MSVLPDLIYGRPIMKATHIEVGNLSDIGLRPGQEKNEDYFGRFDGEYGTLLIVCDGMGGHNGGETASRIAVDAVQSYMSKYHIPTEETMIIHQAIEFAQQKIMEAVNENPAFAGMGSTIVLLLMREHQFWYAHLGDSRLYLVRDEAITRLTRDHSEVQYLVDTGVISVEDARTHPHRNILSKALGHDIGDPEISGPHILYQDDVFLLCTDGLSEYLEDEELLGHLGESPQVAAHNLIEEAKKRGGQDNITVQIVKILHGSSTKTPDDTPHEISNRPAKNYKKYVLPVLIVILGIYILVMIPKTCKKVFPSKTLTGDDSLSVAQDKPAEKVKKKDKKEDAPAQAVENSALDNELKAKLSPKQGDKKLQDFLTKLHAKNPKVPSKLMSFDGKARERSIIFSQQTIFMDYNDLANAQKVNLEQLEYLITISAAIAMSSPNTNLDAILNAPSSALGQETLKAANSLWLSVYPEKNNDFKRIGKVINPKTQQRKNSLIVQTKDNP